MNLTCYRISENAPQLVAARANRKWMDDTGRHFAYRCTPLTIANSTGWELLCPTDLAVTWNGNPGPGHMRIEIDDDWVDRGFAESHFGNGILSFHPGYLFRTDPKWAIWCRGAPNYPKDGIVALDGLVETDWLPFTFTMNWMFTRPGTVRFAKGEPFCFILPVPHVELEEIKPRILPLSADAELAAEHDAWLASRIEYNQLIDEDPTRSGAEPWRRYYFQGKSPRGLTAPETHRTKRKMKEPD